MTLHASGFALTLCVSAALAVLPRVAYAQGSDTLPTLDDNAPLSAPDTVPEPSSEALPPPPITVLQNPSQKPGRLATGPIRAQRRLALLGEIGWNGIAGFGPILTFHLDPHLSFDLGAGLSLMGAKVGLRTRYNFSTARFTPFIGVGVIGAGGFGDSPIPINDKNDPSQPEVGIKVLPSAWLQAVGGVDWIAPSGFNLVGAAGYAWLLSHDPVQIVTGTPNAEEEQALDVAFRSNIVITIALGYSFR